MKESDTHFPKEAPRLAAVSLTQGDFPCGALVVRSDGSILEGLSTSSILNAPTAHAESDPFAPLGAWGSPAHPLC